jgi:hypothetical protein
MRKRVTSQKKGRVGKTTPSMKGRRKLVISICLLLILTFSFGLVAQWRGLPGMSRPSLMTPQSGNYNANSPSKEYIYAGGRLIATEEPVSSAGTSPLSAPSGLNATGNSLPQAQITLTWNAATGGTVDHYQVERCQTYGQNCFTWLADAPASTPTVTYIDNGVSAGAAYLYRVRAVDSSNNFTGYSNADLATAVTFDDDPLISYAENPSGATVIRAAHFTQLRDAVNAVRRLVNPNTAPFQWTTTNNPPPQYQGGIYKSHLDDLRSNLSDALAALGFTRPQYEEPPNPATRLPVKAIHIQQLRNLLK